MLEESGGLDPQRSCAQPASNGRRPLAGSLSILAERVRCRSPRLHEGAHRFQNGLGRRTDYPSMDLPTGVEPAQYPRSKRGALPLSYGRIKSLMVGAPGFDPGRLQQSAAPVYKTELRTSADAVFGRSGWI